MRQNNSITSLMLNHHAKITGLLKNMDNTMESFDRFKWALEKHLFVEEKAIFIYYNPTDDEDIINENYAMIPDLIIEHTMILDMLKEMEDDLRNKGAVDSSELQDLLTKHKDFEDDVLYPKLDRALEDSQKIIITERIGTLI